MISAVAYTTTAVLFVSSMGMLSIYMLRPANEGEATVAGTKLENPKQHQHHIHHRHHPAAPQIANLDNDVKPSLIKEAPKQLAATATPRSRHSRIYPAGSKSRFSSYLPAIRPAPVVSINIRNFGENDVLCYPGDLLVHHPTCKCCGGWEMRYRGETCAVPTLLDCTEDYKVTHFRRARIPIFRNME